MRFIQGRCDHEEPTDMPQSNEREESDYLNFLGVDIKSLKGKTVLNIGAGLTGLVEKAMCKAGVNVIALSPIFANNGPAGKQVRNAYRAATGQRICSCLGIPQNTPILVAGVAEDLPIFDNTIDNVLALYSVPLYSTDNSMVCSEIRRVLKPGGTATLFPIPDEEKEIFQSILDKLEVGSVRFEEINEGSDQVYPDQKTYRLSFVKRAED